MIRGAVERQPQENPLLEALLRLLERRPEEFTEMMAEAAWLGRETKGLSVLAGALARGRFTDVHDPRPGTWTSPTTTARLIWKSCRTILRPAITAVC